MALVGLVEGLIPSSHMNMLKNRDTLEQPDPAAKQNKRLTAALECGQPGAWEPPVGFVVL